MSAEKYAVILAGGKGERFWPLSTSKHPKQFLSLVGDKTLLEQAVDRLDGFIAPDHIFVITNEDLVDVACAAAPTLPVENVIGEPIGRDTAAAIALGAALVKSKVPDGVFAVLTADHIIEDVDLFQQTLSDAMDLASKDDVLLTIGIKPVFASTGYGYIKAGEKQAESKAGILFDKADSFVEKPDAATAEKYVDAGSYYWNSGMFIWSVSAIEKAFAAYRAPLADLIEILTPVVGTDAFAAEFKRVYDGLEKISIDYAIMEHADNVLVARGVFSWDDVGAWPALENHFDKDAANNVPVGSVQVLDASDNIVISKDHLTALIGVKDLIVVQAEGATLICHKDKAQDIKQLVQELRENAAFSKLV